MPEKSGGKRYKMKLYNHGTSVRGWNIIVGDVVRVPDNEESEYTGKTGVVSAIYTGQDAYEVTDAACAVYVALEGVEKWKIFHPWNLEVVITRKGGFNPRFRELTHREANILASVLAALEFPGDNSPCRCAADKLEDGNFSVTSRGVAEKPRRIVDEWETHSIAEIAVEEDTNRLLVSVRCHPVYWVRNTYPAGDAEAEKRLEDDLKNASPAQVEAWPTYWQYLGE